MQLQNKSKQKYKQNWFKYIIMLLLIVTVSCLNKPITVYADSTNVTSLNGEAEHGYGSQVGKMHWAGSRSRTGFIFYFTDEYGNPLSLYELSVTNSDVPIAIRVTNSNYLGEINKATEAMYKIKDTWGTYGYTFDDISDNAVAKITDDNAPSAVQFDESTGRWSGNGQAVANWLFEECSDGRQKWEDIVIRGFNELSLTYGKGERIVSKIKMLEKFNIVILPFAVNAVYGTETWGDEADTFRLGDEDEDFLEYQHPDNYKPAVGEDGKIIRILTTAHYMSQYVYDKTGCATGGANWKWTNEALPFSMTLQEDQVGKIAIPTGTTPSRLDYQTINDSSMSYGMGALTKEVEVDIIDTYDIVNNPSVPAQSEQPVETEDKDTTGDCTITKIYFDVEIDIATSSSTYKFVDVFTTRDTTGFIKLSQESNETGYAIKKWAVTVEEQDFSSYYNDTQYDALINKLSTATLNGNLHTIFHLDNEYDSEDGEMGKRKHLYVVYTKTTQIPPVEYEQHDFEIPESYITKQVYFSQANNTAHPENNGTSALQLQLQEFEWTGEAHNTCTTHEHI